MMRHAVLRSLLLLSSTCGAHAVVSLRRAPGLDGGSERHANSNFAGLELHQHTNSRSDFLHQEMHLMMDEDEETPLEAQLDDTWAAERPGPHRFGSWILNSVENGRDVDKPPTPLPIYEDADAAAGYLESQRGNDFFPEGSKSDLDVAPDQRRTLKNAFEERPDLFQNCMLIRDFAEPLRVGSAIIQQQPAEPAAPGNDTEHEQEDKKSLPDDVLVVKGSVFDRGAGKASEAELQVNMFAFLRSIAGEVAVIPNGAMARWSSKKKVPIAGYLCTESGHRVLYTLPTPCLATSLDDDGMPRPPPPVMRSVSDAPAPAPVQSPAPAAPNGLGSLLSTGVANQLGSGQNKSFLKQRSSLDPEKVEPATSEDFVVFLGSKKLFFSSKSKAESFCLSLTESIADDMGDHEFDLDTLTPTSFRKDLSAGDFLQLTRKYTPADWTIGTKSLLVLVMDWQYGDNSRRPYSKQTKSVAHYRDEIFPQVRSAFQRMSFGKFDIVPTFVPEVIRFTSPRSQYAMQGYPFPGLYIGAETSLAASNYGNMYRFADYDLVYVIAPQQAPVGTRGVAWVGAKGALCNGCEEIKDSFQVMVAVHELGHNLGLAHASSKSLEYGNPFDWMGNYPDVVGLSFGAGYKRRLNWLSSAAVATISASEFGNLNDRYVLKPFDEDQEPGAGEFAAIQLQLSSSHTSNDLYITYRHSAGEEKGVYITLQDKGKPDSELVDLACHTSSQKDARMRPGWTYLDPTSKVVVYLESVTDTAATLHLFHAEPSKIADIRGLADFTDGLTKCPRTCTDSDLLLAQFHGCSVLAGKGYCNGGSIVTDGVSKSIGTELCPASCGNCEQALAGSPVVGSAASPVSLCSDRNILIGGKDCWQARLAGYCVYNTNLGHVGRDLCPKSCGECPPPPPAPSSHSSFQNPIAQRTHGAPGSFVAAAAMPAIPISQAATESALSTSVDAGHGTECVDETSWQDTDGHGCTVYAEYIGVGRLTQGQACNYGDGSAVAHCKKTCGMCGPASSTSPAPPVAAPSTTPAPAPVELIVDDCKDSRCVESWYQAYGECYNCSDYAATYCGQDALFMQSCPKSCKLCSASPPPPCGDDFKKESCEEWQGLGFCDQPKIRRSCKKTCGFCSDSQSAALKEEKGYLSTAYDYIYGTPETAISDDWEWGSRPALKHAVKVKQKRALRIERNGAKTSCVALGALAINIVVHLL